MALEIQIHAVDPDGDPKTITLAQTNTDTGTIAIATPGAGGDPYDLSAIRVDPATLRVQCKAHAVFLSIDVEIAVAQAVGRLQATITISQPFGDETTVYGLRAGDDAVLRRFLTDAAFPSL